MKIAVDAFGGDNAPQSVTAGVLAALDADMTLSVVLAGDKDKIIPLLGDGYPADRLEIIDAKDVITNDDSPTMAIKTKKDSSLVRTLDALAESDEVGGFVSAGSTGAVLAGAFMKVGRIKGISRPALAPVLPTVTDKKVILCDCGANVDCKAVNLLHFGIMANAYAEAMLGVERPRVGLISNGAEDKKGTELNREAFALLKEEESIDFVGNCEARDILSGDFDVVVADGFNGNIALKAAEGTANAIFKIMMDGVSEGGLRAKLGALMMKPVLRKVKRRMDYNSQGGACFLGLNKVVVKAHGSSEAKSICASILQASELAKADVCGRIKRVIDAKKDTAEE